MHFLNEDQTSHNLFYEGHDDDEPVYDFDVIEAYGLRDSHPRAPTAHSHFHSAPSHEHETYYDLTHHYPHTHEHLKPHLEHSSHHFTTVTDKETSRHYTSPIDHEKERRDFEEKWAVDHHHPAHPAITDFNPYKIHHEEIRHPSTTHFVAPHVQKHTDFEHFEIEGRHRDHHPTY